VRAAADRRSAQMHGRVCCFVRCSAGAFHNLGVVDPSTRQLRSFVVLAEELSFTRAAERLYVAQQALSSQIARLEECLGVVLFVRSTRQVRLTPAGERYLEGARAALAMLDDALQAARGGDAASTAPPLKVGFLETAALELTEPILAAFRDRRPDVAVELVGTSYADPSCGLADGRTDVALVRMPIGATDISSETVFTEALTLAVHSTHPFAAQSSVTLADALQQPLLAPATDDAVWRAFWLLDRFRADASERAAVIQSASVSSAASELHGVGIGSACTIATTSTYRVMPTPHVRFVRIEGAPPVGTRGRMAHRSGR
jgi:DNA-binding transcriptional LysR family regulator